ncbi:N-acetylmuramoyl-L-alanine amidase [Halomonas getboli]|uniref:N-acetylmuramoyl-L-alanine amidase n=1 Tax=Halomonas getboli TaxID=2935862 RepID=UPI001FFFD6E1|nr:N-acetylmuramoyl-L-alanine amidase [Halomonas getboli]MCK2183613.1 N-acetylmuramoyl-L-alanine amidase [Halomonas getboli]
MERRRFLGALAVLSLFPSSLALADERRANRYSLSSSGGSATLTIELPEEADYRSFSLDGPPRFVIDLKRIDRVLPTHTVETSGTIVKRVRTGARQDGVRLVVDLARSVPTRVTMQDAGRGLKRLVVQLGEGDPIMALMGEAKAADDGPRPAVIAIDAGHGGRDPGCISASDHYEKFVALGIAAKLCRRLEADARFRPIMTRDDDTFIPLHERVLIARDRQADMFVSLHADSAPRTSASGASVYVLGADDAGSAEARWLAESENSADRYASTRQSRIYSQDPEVQDILLDLSMSSTLASSRDLAKTMLHHLSQTTNLHNDRVNAAGFAVLKSPEIPSILVENGFMSNHQDCQRLLTDGHQQALAEALHQSIGDYFERYPLHA